MTHNPLIYYWSSPTGNTAALTHSIPHTTLPIIPHTRTTHPYILLTPSYDQPRGGFTPKQVEQFLQANAHNMVGMIGTGNINFGAHYCQAAKDIAKQHSVPLLARVDMRGNEEDHTRITQGIDTHWDTLYRMRGSAHSKNENQ